MLSSSSEFPKRIALENNLFKFKQQIQSHESEGGINECLSSPSSDDESIEQSLLIEKAIVAKSAKRQEISEYKKHSKSSIHTKEYHGKKQGKKQAAAAAVSMHIGQNQFLRNIQDQQIHANNFTGDNKIFDEDIDQEYVKQKEQSRNDIIQSISHSNQNTLQNLKQKKKRKSIQSESEQEIMDEEDKDIEEDSNSSNDGEDIEDDDENEEEDDGDDDEDEDDQEEDKDYFEKDGQQIIKRKSSNNQTISTKAGKISKNIRKQNKKPGRKGNQGRGKHQDTKHSSPQHNGKRCNNQFCKFPYKGDLKRVKIKFKSEYVHLCQKCTERFKQKCYCLYCGQVYYDSNEGDGKLWIQCEDCLYWLHQECEKDNGLSDIDSLIEDDSYKFYCLRCRDKNKSFQQDKLQLNIQKAQMQIAKSLSGVNNDNNYSSAHVNSSPNGSDVIENNTSQQKLNKRQYKKNQKDKSQSNSIKSKCKVSLASLQKQLNKPIFAPKPDQPESQNIIKNTNNLQLSHNQNSIQISTNDQSSEPKKQKKICNEENKSGAYNNVKSSPEVNHTQTENFINHNTDSTNHSSDYYSFQLFLKAKKQNSQKQSIQNGISHFSTNLIDFNHSTPHENHISNQEHHNKNHNNNNHNHQNTQLSSTNPYSHHNRQRKEDSMNYVELPYKKQTVKENNSKRMFYHYSILQELLNPLNLSLTLNQEDINVDLQILRSISIDGGKRPKDEDAQSTQLNFHIDDYSANQVNLSSSSQYEYCHNKQSPKVETSEFINLTPVKKNKVFDDIHTKSLKMNSPISPNK